MTPELLKRIKTYFRMIITSLGISFGMVYAACFFNNCTLLEVFTVQEPTIVAWVAIGVNVMLIATCALTIIMNSLPLPKLPGGPWEREQLIVCRYSELAFSMIGLFCVGFGLFMMYGAGVNLVAVKENPNAMGLGLVLGTLGPMFILLGVVFFLFMKNYMVIFYPEGVYYQNAFGKPYVATDEQIEYVSVIPAYRDRSFRLCTTDRNLWLNRYCSEYYEAEKYVQKQYMDFATYQELQKSGQER